MSGDRQAAERRFMECRRIAADPGRRSHIHEQHTGMVSEAHGDILDCCQVWPAFNQLVAPTIFGEVVRPPVDRSLSTGER